MVAWTYIHCGHIAHICQFESISFSVGPLCLNFMSAWLSLAGSTHNCTVLLVLDSMLKILNHSAISSTPSGSSICFLVVCIILFKWFLEGVYHMLQECLVQFYIILICRQKVALKHRIPVNTLPYSSCTFDVGFCTCLLASMSGNVSWLVSSWEHKLF